MHVDHPQADAACGERRDARVAARDAALKVHSPPLHARHLCMCTLCVYRVHPTAAMHGSGGWDNGHGTLQQQQGTFLHELGHNLNLLHGGNDDVNCQRSASRHTHSCSSCSGAQCVRADSVTPCAV